MPRRKKRGNPSSTPKPPACPASEPPAPFKPSQLLLGLPDLAAECLVQQLAACGSRSLAELMTLCKDARGMVAAHAHHIRYSLGNRHLFSSESHKFLHTVATRPWDLHLTLEVTPSSYTASARLELQTVLLAGLQVERGSAGGRQRGWTAVTRLTIKLGLHSQVLGMCTSWGNLVGASCPALRALRLQCVAVEPGLYSGLALCPHLSSLTFEDSSFTDDARAQLPLVVVAAPRLRSLHVVSAEPQPHSHSWVAPTITPAMASQLTHLSLPSSPVPANLTRLVSVHIVHRLDGARGLEQLMQLPALRHVTIGKVEFREQELDKLGALSAVPAATSWATLTLTKGACADVLGVLPLAHVQCLRLGHLEVGLESRGAGAKVGRAVTVLLAMWGQGRLRWLGQGQASPPETASAWGCDGGAGRAGRHEHHAGEGEGEAGGEGGDVGSPMVVIKQLSPGHLNSTTMQRVLKSVAHELAPMCMCMCTPTGGLRLVLSGVAPCVGRQHVEVLAGSLGNTLRALEVSGSRLGSSFWLALRQLPGLGVLEVSRCWQLGASALALFVATHPHRLRLVLSKLGVGAQAKAVAASRLLAMQRVVGLVTLSLEPAMSGGGMPGGSDRSDSSDGEGEGEEEEDEAHGGGGGSSDLDLDSIDGSGSSFDDDGSSSGDDDDDSSSDGGDSLSNGSLSNDSWSSDGSV